MPAAVKVVLVKNNGEERELGPFNHGVFFADTNDGLPRATACCDTAAAVTSNIIARLHPGVGWMPVPARESGEVYKRLHVHAVEPTDQVLSLPSSPEAVDAIARQMGG